MKFNELKVNKRVFDRWFVNHPTDNLRGTGIIKKILKTRVIIKFNGELITYSKSHVQFLEPIKHLKKFNKT